MKTKKSDHLKHRKEKKLYAQNKSNKDKSSMMPKGK